MNLFLSSVLYAAVGQSNFCQSITDKPRMDGEWEIELSGKICLRIGQEQGSKKFMQFSTFHFTRWCSLIYFVAAVITSNHRGSLSRFRGYAASFRNDLSLKLSIRSVDERRRKSYKQRWSKRLFLSFFFDTFKTAKRRSSSFRHWLRSTNESLLNSLTFMNDHKKENQTCHKTFWKSERKNHIT